MLLKERWPNSSYRSAVMNGESHWYLRIQLADTAVDVDITADQFGLSPIQVGLDIYPDSKERHENEIDEDTRRRFSILKTRYRELALFLDIDYWWMTAS
jgi:hypothetical protein